jgi:hypothetical protein
LSSPSPRSASWPGLPPVPLCLWPVGLSARHRGRVLSHLLLCLLRRRLLGRWLMSRWLLCCWFLSRRLLACRLLSRRFLCRCLLHLLLALPSGLLLVRHRSHLPPVRVRHGSTIIRRTHRPCIGRKSCPHPRQKGLSPNAPSRSNDGSRLGFRPSSLGIEPRLPSRVAVRRK